MKAQREDVIQHVWRLQHDDAVVRLTAQDPNGWILECYREHTVCKQRVHLRAEHGGAILQQVFDAICSTHDHNR